MPVTGNKGEWSEIYAFLRLLADARLFAADEQLNRIQNMFFPIIKIIREETVGTLYEYQPNKNKAAVEIYLNDSLVLHVSAGEFEAEANYLFSEINSAKNRGAFEIAKTESFIRGIYVNKLKAPSSDKSDIKIQIHDFHTGYKNIVGFSIKSELGMSSTLLNAGKTTNFVYRVNGLNGKHIPEINSVKKIKDRVKAIINNGGKLVFCNMQNEVFNNNLMMIDSQMRCIVAEMLIGYYSGAPALCTKLAEYVSRANPLSCNAGFYRHKIKEMLCAVALGMQPATLWNGMDEASGGCIIVRTNGEVLAYHIYNRDAFKEYLLNNTKFETGSSKRHDYGILYENAGKIYIKLNLQIRFI